MADVMKTYMLGVTITLELEVEVKAKDFADAAESYKSKKLNDFVKIPTGVTLNDCSYKLRSISTGEWLNGA